ncbi:phosphoinositide phosphatase SAC8 isoform X1 [Beta vulgaris subsp. vulgaris]|uniref:phosphoinositide phosphatase SAC8 isoform X1 n=1 Tax=Beta vulgaris subsp. vulgaris TaxID=3555 RepID=UPI00053F7A71|nr:phosphoinositide phosphatase SAC8 isoform X1 [Beta vulgaris subsp. vulgaris]
MEEREIGIKDESSPSSATNFRLFDEMELLEFKDKYVIRRISSPNEGFSANRFDGDIQPLNSDDVLESPVKTSKICGVVGTIRLVAGMYIIVITSSKEVGTYHGSPIHRVESMKYLPCNLALKELSTQDKKDEAYFTNLLRVVESTPGLYYSYETDITVNLQRRLKLAAGWQNKPIWKQADPRYVWNRALLDELIEHKLDGFIISLVQGSFQTAELTLNNAPVTITLISRRCTRRLGTRMWRRGANLEGDAANFIETEQLLELKDFKSSFLQVRGSIPLLWEQIVDLSYKPRLNIINHQDTSKIVERHFNDLSQRYGEILALDLTDEHGAEGKLSSAYATEMKKLPNVSRYVPFRFHSICGKSSFDNLHVLYDEISEDFGKQGYFLVDSGENVLEEQRGVIRSNCIDCLDRTNVTQSYLARLSLDLQLRRSGVFSHEDTISICGEEFDKFKILWVEQGDELSIEYTGTHALKRDLVRYGKQTLGGLITDGMSAVSRYYLNNFQDGVRQDAIDLISGRYSVGRNNPSPFQLNAFESLSYLPVASALLIGGLTLTSFSLNQVGRNAQQFVSSVLWAGVTAGVMALVKANGRQFCSRPRLCGLI